MYAAMSRWLRRSSYWPRMPATGPPSPSVSTTSNGSIRSTGAVARDLDHDVELRRAVVDDPEADTAVVQAGRHIQIRDRRVEPSARMVVEQHLAPLRDSGQRQHHVDGAAGDRARAATTTPSRSTCATNDTSRPPAAAISPAQVSPHAGGDPLGLTRAHGQVLSSFFLAAGNSTLLRISR